MPLGYAIVVDIGKTMSKVSLWSREGKMLDRATRLNETMRQDGLLRLDADGIGEWLVEALAAWSGEPVEYAVPVAHGAGVAALDGDSLAFAPLDYEQELPAPSLKAYRQRRDAFVRSGSPALPAGLNIGAQLHWLEQLYPARFAEATLLPWAQYWAWFLSGKAVSEVTSLGCHSDLWLPQDHTFSDLARDAGWARKFAPLARAGKQIGTLRPEISAATGLPADCRVLAGLHDSNAALLAASGYPEIAKREATILSTGTWFIAMRLPVEPVDIAVLPEGRDCLVNVDPQGRPVPSARFMGGREIETLIEFDTHQVDIRPDQPNLLAAVSKVVAAGSMVLPTFAPGSGPFPNHKGRWIARPEDRFARRAAACLYAALIAERALALIDAKGLLLVEGRFAEAEVFVRALASLRPDISVHTADAHNDVSFGALRLVEPNLKCENALHPVEPLPVDLASYREAWLAAVKVPA